RLLNPILPRALEQLVERAMAKRRQDRFASAAEFLEALERSQVRRPHRLMRTLVPVAVIAAVTMAVTGAALIGARLGAGSSRHPRAAAASLEVKSAEVPAASSRLRERSQPAPIRAPELTAVNPADSHATACEALRKARTCKERKAAALELIRS